MPLFGLGVFQVPVQATTKEVCGVALSAGYRHIDTARIYGNERSVGEAIQASGIPRSEIFVTTKLWNTDHGFAAAQAAGLASLRTLGLDYVDLYLVHWPVEKLRLDTWRGMEALLEAGKTRAIGVSNYMVKHLEELLAQCDVVPAVNQIELHPYNYEYRLDVIELCRQNDILVEAYCPLTRARKFDDPRLIDIAKTYGKSPAQILLRWALEHRFAVIPKSSQPDRIRENANVFDFSLSDSDKRWLDDFNEDLVIAWDPTDAP